MGKCLDYVKYAIETETDDCILWPFATNPKGYGSIYVDGKVWLVHRYIQTIVNGPSPPGKPQCGHSCGVTGCVNEKHLKWCNQFENEADKIIHGTKLYGEKHNMAVLTEENVLFCRKLFSKGHAQNVLARSLGVDRSTISLIVNRKIWAHI